MSILFTYCILIKKTHFVDGGTAGEFSMSILEILNAMVPLGHPI